jgi:PKD repeat protein
MNRDLKYYALIFIFAGLGLASCSKKNEPEPVYPPTAGFTASSDQNGTITFTNTSTHADSFNWDFGDYTDHSYSQEKDPQHHYSKNGTFTVTLVATGKGGTDTKTYSVVISSLLSSVTFKNGTFTSMSITINGKTKTLYPSDTIKFIGKPNASLTGSAFTAGYTSTGAYYQLGEKIVWNIDRVFQEKDIDVQLNVSSAFFYLNVKNSSGEEISKILVNYGLMSQTTDIVEIPSDGVTLGCGYYKAFSNSNVRLENNSSYWFWDTITLDNTPNQVINLEAI